jgi:hypothetical protein
MLRRNGLILVMLAGLVASGCSNSNTQAAGGAAAATPTVTTAEATRPLKVLDNKPPRFLVDKQSYNFHKMDQHQVGNHNFEIRNDGDGILLLRIQHTTCGCTSVKLGDVMWDPKNPAPKTIVTLAPGSKVDLEMNWKTEERMGEFKTNANVETNDPKQPVVTFSVEGEIIPYIQISQSQVKMEDVRNGGVTNSSTFVYSKKFEDLQLTDVSSSNPLISAETEPADEFFLKSVQAVSGSKILIKVAPGLPIGPFAASLEFNTNKEERPKVTIQVTGHVMGDVLLSPTESLEFGSVKVAEGMTKTIFVKIVGDSPIEVKLGRVGLLRQDVLRTDPDKVGDLDAVKVEDDILNVTLTQFESAKNRWQLKVQVPAGSPGGKFKGIIELETTHPTAKLVKIPVRFQVTR